MNQSNCDRKRRRILPCDGGHEVRGGRHPRFGRRSRQALLRQSGLEARRRLRRRRHLPRRAVHASGLPGLDSLRQGSEPAAPGSASGTLSRRLRHRGGARRARQPRCRGERNLPPSPVRDIRRSAAGSGAAQLRHPTPRSAIRTATTWLLQEVTARFPGRIDPNYDELRLRIGSGERVPARVGRPRRAREANWWSA